MVDTGRGVPAEPIRASASAPGGARLPSGRFPGCGPLQGRLADRWSCGGAAPAAAGSRRIYPRYVAVLLVPSSCKQLTSQYTTRVTGARAPDERAVLRSLRWHGHSARWNVDRPEACPALTQADVGLATWRRPGAMRWARPACGAGIDHGGKERGRSGVALIPVRAWRTRKAWVAPTLNVWPSPAL